MKKVEKGEKFQREKIGKPEYINENCWLVKTINHSPGDRCQYCESKFRNCLFFQYLITSLILIIFLFTLSFLIEGKISKLLIISIFVLVIVYGRFFNKSTEKIIKANFAQRKAKESLEELAEKLEEKVDEQTKEIKEAYKKVEKAYEVEKEAKKKIEELGEAKTQFMLATQHHFRTPLTSINGYIDLILTGAYGKVSSKLKETILKIKISTNRLIRVVGEVLDITQFQMGKKPIFNLLKTKIEPVVKEVLEELQFTARSKNIYLKLEKPKTEIPLVSIDVEKMKVALFNIVDNGIKYTNQGGVTVKLEVKDNKLRIMSKDTGIGITPEEMEALFVDIFERGEEAKKLFGTGQGIGLYVANQIIKGHGGRVWVESEGRGKGSTFYIELPVK